MTQETLLRQIADYANRANPYPLYAQLRKTPVSRQEDGTYVVSTYREIVALLHDPRISSDERNRSQADAPPSQSHEAQQRRRAASSGLTRPTTIGCAA